MFKYKRILLLFAFLFFFFTISNAYSFALDNSSALDNSHSQSSSLSNSSTSAPLASSVSVSTAPTASSPSFAASSSASGSNTSQANSLQSPSKDESSAENSDTSINDGAQTQNTLPSDAQFNNNAPIILCPPPYEFTATEYFNSNSALGIAGSFHVVGFGTVRINAHTNGNILTNNLFANSNFGTNNLADELSYVVQYEQVNSGSATSLSHVLAVGSTNTVELVDNGNAIAINGTKLDRPKTVWKDYTAHFIDMAAVKNSVQTLSSTISTYAEFNITESLDTNGGSVDESYIELTDPNKAGVFNTTASELSALSYLGVKGFSSANSVAVIINVNCEGVSQLNLPISLISVDGNNQQTSETHTFTNGRVLWNFYNYLPDFATSITSSILHGSILADGANFTASQNLNGTIIANNISINAETHRDDFICEIPVPETDISVTVNKLWRSEDGSEMDSSGYSAIVQLLQNSIAHGPPVTLDEMNNFTYTFDGLPSEFVYTVEEQNIFLNEENVTALFETSTQYGTNTITLINTLKSTEPLILPATGGNLHLLTAIGIALTSISIILLFLLRRKK